MKKLKRDQNRALAIALIMTLMLVAGIPAIPVGFALGYTAVGVAGIVCTVIGFYGCPVAWVAFGGYVPLKRLVYAVEEENILTVPELSAHLRRSEKDVKASIARAIDKLYLQGYLFDGVNLTPNTKKKTNADGAAHTGKCPSCGAPLPLPPAGAKYIQCPYCDTTVRL